MTTTTIRPALDNLPIWSHIEDSSGYTYTLRYTVLGDARWHDDDSDDYQSSESMELDVDIAVIEDPSGVIVWDADRNQR